MFTQAHRPGEAGQTDFTETASLAILHHLAELEIEERRRRRIERNQKDSELPGTSRALTRCTHSALGHTPG